MQSQQRSIPYSSPLLMLMLAQAAVQPSSIFADISSPSSRVPTNQPFTLKLRGGMTVTGSTGLQLMGSVSDGCSLQLQNANPAVPGTRTHLNWTIC
jgi:hypothetical protein